MLTLPLRSRYRQLQNKPTQNIFEGAGQGVPPVPPVDPLISNLTAWWKFDESGGMSDGANPRYNSVAPTDPNQAFTQILPETLREYTSGTGIIANGMASPTDPNYVGAEPRVGVDGITPDYPRSANDSFSFAYWVKITLKDTDGDIPGIRFGVDNDFLSFTVEGSFYSGAWHLYPGVWNGVDAGQYLEFVWDYTVDQWYHFAYVYNGDTGLLSFYIDGVLQGITDAPEIFSADGLVKNIALEVDSYNNTFIMDELGLWIGYALTYSNIIYLFNGGDGVTTPLNPPAAVQIIGEGGESMIGEGGENIVGE